VLDCRSFGGQAGASARIENYLGFDGNFRHGLDGASLARLHQLDAIFTIFGASDRDKRLILQGRGLRNACSADQAPCAAAGGARVCVMFLRSKIRRATKAGKLHSTMSKPFATIIVECSGPVTATQP
jgi:hypothetical protein